MSATDSGVRMDDSVRLNASSAHLEEKMTYETVIFEGAACRVPGVIVGQDVPRCADVSKSNAYCRPLARPSRRTLSGMRKIRAYGNRISIPRIWWEA